MYAIGLILIFVLISVLTSRGQWGILCDCDCSWDYAIKDMLQCLKFSTQFINTFPHNSNLGCNKLLCLRCANNPQNQSEFIEMLSNFHPNCRFYDLLQSTLLRRPRLSCPCILKAHSYFVGCEDLLGEYYDYCERFYPVKNMTTIFKI
jgi:hypothetical protein